MARSRSPCSACHPFKESFSKRQATMAKQTKTDNHNPKAKLDLRRYFLRKYHAGTPIDVMDCCQGSGLLWNKLQEEFPVTSYWGMDLKPKKGRLKLDSSRVLEQPGWTQNVIDIDTYGSPWKHWLALLPNVARPTTVFLTIGRIIVMGGSPASRQELDACGANFKRLALPQSFGPVIAENAISYLLSSTCDNDIITTEAVEAVSNGNARYIGLRLEKSSG